MFLISSRCTSSIDKFSPLLGGGSAHKDRKGFPENRSIRAAAETIRVQVHPPRSDYMEIRFNRAVQTNRNEVQTN